MIDTELADFLNADTGCQVNIPGGAWLGMVPAGKSLPALAYKQLSGAREGAMSTIPNVNATWQITVVGKEPLATRQGLKAALARLTYYSGELTTGGTYVQIAAPIDESGPHYDVETDLFICDAELPMMYSDEPNLNT